MFVFHNETQLNSTQLRESERDREISGPSLSFQKRLPFQSLLVLNLGVRETLVARMCICGVYICNCVKEVANL